MQDLQHRHVGFVSTRLAGTNGVSQKEMVNHNYELALRYYSYQVLHRKLRSLILDCFGE